MASPKGAEPETGVDRTTDAYHRLRQFIVNGQLAPGSRIIETEVAEKLGVSRTPVRSALQRLRHEGFIQGGDPGEPSRLTVAPLTRQDAQELFEVVGALEGVAAGRTARLPAPEREPAVRHMEEVNEALQELDSATPPTPTAFFELDHRFHQTCVDAGAGPRLRRLHAFVKPQAERYVRIYVSTLRGMVATSVEEHADILSAVRSGLPNQARETMRRNWANAADRLARIIDSVGEKGTW